MSDTDEDLVLNSGLTSLSGKPAFHSEFNVQNKTIANCNQPNHYMDFDQRSMYSRKETSPMTVKSFANSRMPYKQSYYRSNMSSRGSVYNGRSRSPMSIRTIDSNASVSAADIVSAFKNVQFNKYDLRLIKDAYNTYMKNRVRRRIEKKRRLKSFIKQCGKKCGGESGVEGSDSTISSDDGRSTISAFYKENMPRMRAMPQRIDCNRYTIQPVNNDVYTDCTENLKQNSFKNFLDVQSRSVNHSSMSHSIPRNPIHSDRYINLVSDKQMLQNGTKKVTEIVLNVTHNGQNNEQQENLSSTFCQKERFTKDATQLLPFQRFNKNNVKPTEYDHKGASKTMQHKINNKSFENVSESEEIFSHSTRRANSTITNPVQLKRVLDVDNISYPEGKRSKLTLKTKNQIEYSDKNKAVNTKSKDFNFKKPQLPSKKLCSTRDTNSEVLISKSSQPILGNLEPTYSQLKLPQINIILEEEDKACRKSTKQISQNYTDTVNNNTLAETTHTDVSSRPSFIKRKLFTQKLDMIENKNLSSDSLGVNSPNTKKVKTCKEKHKVRKLTSQSCLSHDVGDNNFLDLIHKIVPPNQMNVTNVTNKKEVNKSRKGKDDEWDIISAISMCKNDDASDTYTDEEIFNAQQESEKTAIKSNKEPRKGENKVTKGPQNKQNTVPSQCKVVVEKMTVNRNQLSALCTNKKRLVNSVKLFWDTDFECDTDDDYMRNEGNQIQTGSRNESSNGNNITRNALTGSIFSKSLRNRTVENSFGSDFDVNQSENGKKTENVHVENNKSIYKRDRSRAKSKENSILTQCHNLENSTTNVSKKSKPKVNDKENERQEKISKPLPSTKTKVPQEKMNISRESLRPRQKAVQENRKSTSTNNVNTKSSKITHNNKLNTSRESVRLKQKRESKLNLSTCKKC